MTLRKQILWSLILGIVVFLVSAQLSQSNANSCPSGLVGCYSPTTYGFPMDFYASGTNAYPEKQFMVLGLIIDGACSFLAGFVIVNRFFNKK